METEGAAKEISRRL